MLKGKRLLILGGSAYMVDPVLKAKEMGLYTIVTDWHELEKSPAKQIADEYWNISLMAYDQLVPKIKEEKIKGVIALWLNYSSGKKAPEKRKNCWSA